MIGENGYMLMQDKLQRNDVLLQMGRRVGVHLLVIISCRQGMELKHVCKKFFLGTLGYSCDSILTESRQSAGSEHFFPQNAKRGSHNPSHKLKEEVILQLKEHIMRYHPQVSHYRREYAPNRLYLHTDVNATEMFADFNLTYPKLVSYETYRRQIKK